MTTPRNHPEARDPRKHAVTIAEVADKAWHHGHGHGELEIPLSVVAMLSLISPTGQARERMAAALINLPPTAFAHLIRRTCKSFIRARPDLVTRAWPLLEPWLCDREMPDDTVCAAKATADAVLRAGMFALTDETRHDVDLLGTVLTALRPNTALQARGQYYTPVDVSNVMAGMLGAPSDTDAVNDPACGTGGMFRAVAQQMRAAGRDPATATWEGNDVDADALACCAVNVVLWGLGPNVLLGIW